MSYKKKKKELSSTRKKKRIAEAEAVELESKIEQLHKDFEASYQALTKARARHEIESSRETKKAVTDAEKKNQSIKGQITEAKEALDTKTEVVNILSEKLQKVDAEFKKIAADYHRDKAKPVVDEVTDLMEQAEEKLDELDAIRKEVQHDGLHAPDRFTAGISAKSQIAITKNGIPGMETRNYITTENLKSE